MHLFETQDLLTITVKTKYSSLASASVTRILWKKPSGEKGYWDANVSGSDLVYNVQANDLSEGDNGVWEFQAYIEISGKKGFGEIEKHTIKKPLI